LGEKANGVAALAAFLIVWAGGGGEKKKKKINLVEGKNNQKGEPQRTITPRLEGEGERIWCLVKTGQKSKWPCSENRRGKKDKHIIVARKRRKLEREAEPRRFAQTSTAAADKKKKKRRDSFTNTRARWEGKR